MATYEKYTLNLTRHEGNRQDVIITLSNLDMDDISKITFQVRDTDEVLLISKSSEVSGEIDISGQTFTVNLAPADTRGHDGEHNYEIDLCNSSDEAFATIGGTFTITSEVNTT